MTDPGGLFHPTREVAIQRPITVRSHDSTELVRGVPFSLRCYGGFGGGQQVAFSASSPPPPEADEDGASFPRA